MMDVKKAEGDGTLELRTTEEAAGDERVDMKMKVEGQTQIYMKAAVEGEL